MKKFIIEPYSDNEVMIFDAETKKDAELKIGDKVNGMTIKQIHDRGEFYTYFLK